MYAQIYADAYEIVWENGLRVCVCVCAARWWCGDDGECLLLKKVYIADVFDLWIIKCSAICITYNTMQDIHTNIEYTHAHTHIYAKAHA